MLTNAIDILKDLNVEQRAIVKSIDGSYFVLSGPGSGKTRCLVARTQYMLRNHISPESILLFTFTNKAANEIRERIKHNIDVDIADKITIGTYHSICLRILKKYYKSTGFLKKNFSVYDQDDSYNVLKKICSDSCDYYEAASYISHCKDNLMSPTDAFQEAQINNTNIVMPQIYAAYQNALIKNNAIDFDDIIYHTVKLLENHHKIHDMLTSQYKYITSDETQDASVSNIRLLELLSGLNNNICMFLDDDQSIYAFRGANVEHVLSSTDKFKGIQTLYLNRNYRSTQNIVNASVGVINQNNTRMKKQLFTENNIGDKIVCFSRYNKEQEAIRVYEIIRFLQNKKGLNYKQIAVLYRNNSQCKNVEQYLLKNNIPYDIKNNIAFCERKEIKDIIAYLRLIVNHYDYEAFARVINVPKRGIGAKTVQTILSYIQSEEDVDTIAACREIIEKKIIRNNIADKLTSFLDMIDNLSDLVDDYEPYEYMKFLIQTISYREAIKEYDHETYTERYVNVLELLNIAKQFVDINDFISSFTVNRDSIDNIDSNKVTLSTIHGCKGLEWDAVIIIGLNDEILPGKSNVEEERRLFYVAMTRAKQYLFLSNYLYEANRPNPNKRCRFIDEIEKEYISHIK